ncbi:putative toxin-antitoxin system toxin component, PIN family [Pseudanabaena sp. PCC 6802]|uniref:putative toxin-antitoxin system toxin component, PIN family n=1 Tax=Pseudanabaena sp. PCC 6802 TaxID=118173 RepID=UPI000345E6F4|nr:putative toxin-antitoxin system toxin component, PIN family [Pseudanabaena sp. PCC 6802]
MRIVLDVNVWISGLLWGGTPSRLFRLARNTQISLFVSDTLLLELETTLRHAKFQQRLQQRACTVETLMAVVRELSEICPTVPIRIAELRDPKDNKILGTALSANAEALITGDLDLLVLIKVNGIPILNPQDFLNRYYPE